jgi:hypothetical protein
MRLLTYSIRQLLPGRVAGVRLPPSSKIPFRVRAYFTTTHCRDVFEQAAHDIR